MTTITYKDGIMAADTGLYDDRINYGYIKKIVRLEDGSLFGCAGDADVRDLIDLLNSRGEKVSRKELVEVGVDVNGILVKPNGDIFLIDVTIDNEESKNSGQVVSIIAPFIAIGAGKDMALGAMAAGVGAVLAIELTARHNKWTSLPVWAMPLHV